MGFVTGLASGTKDLFYEPFEVLNVTYCNYLIGSFICTICQGALLGPEQFIQGLGHGVHGFVGATIGNNFPI